MNYKRKCEIVEALKENERAYCFLSDEEKEVIRDLKSRLRVDRLCRSGSWITSFIQIHFGDVYRIHRDYFVPIEAPEGYRLVTEEEKEKYDKPTDYRFCYSYSVDWNEPISRGAEWGGGGTLYAVPLDFSFEQEVKEISAEEAMRILADKFGCEIKLTK